MRYRGEIEGVVSSLSEIKPTPRKIMVNYTSDSIGKTLSLGSVEDDISISIPYDALIKILK